MHSELTLGGDGVVMVSDERVKQGEHVWQSPASTETGVNTQGLFVYVDDADKHCDSVAGNTLLGGTTF